MRSAPANRGYSPHRLVAALTLVGVLLLVQMYALAWKAPHFGLDLGPVWASAWNLVHGNPIYAGEVSSITFSFLPPSGALLTSPMGLVGFDVAAKVFLGIQIVALVAATLFFVRRFCVRQRLPTLVGAAIALALGQPFVYTLQFGSMNGLVLASMLAFMVGAADDRPWAGPLLGLSLALKPVLWPLAIVLVVRRQYRQVGAAMVVASGIVALAMVLVRDGSEFLTKVLPYLAEGEPGMERFNVSILGLTQQAGWPGGSAVAGRLVVVGFAVALCVRLWRRAPDDLDLVEAGTALVLAGILVSSWATFYYAAFAFPAVLLFRDPRSAASSLAIWPFLLAVGVSIQFGPDLAVNSRTFLGLLGLTVLIGLRAWRRRPGDAFPATTPSRPRIAVSRI